MNSLPLVSVIIPSYNYEAFIGQCVESVLNQDYPNIEILIIDDGSQDNSVKLLEKMGAPLKIIRQNNQGVSSARNRGLMEAKGEYIAFLDADDYWASSKIRKQLTALIENRVDLIYSGINLVSPDGTQIFGKLEPKFRGDCSSFYRKHPSTAIVLLGTSNALFRKEIITRSGLFDPKLSISADWDFFRRYCDYAKVEFVDEELTFYRQHPANMSSYSDHFVSDTVRCVRKMLTDDYPSTKLIERTRILFSTYLLVLKYKLKSR